MLRRLIISIAHFAALTLWPAAPASAAFPNLTLIYVMSGVTDDGRVAFDGIATVVHCTNWSTGNISLRFVVRNHAGVPQAGKTYAVNSLAGLAVSTHETLAYNENDLLSAGIVVVRGTIQIFSTSPLVSCSADVISAAAGVPDGVALHLIRFNPWPGTVE